ncbi:hypothetical protein H0H81_004737 [Sphagnurus paluster]|uniref:RNA polymerase II-associated protein 1 n=1 Tax=Sphagnurus paluster TaxID=117069 RepID=A0A9P7GTQ3_9AGAR|nr:hypothetical protein H0H81_004737 [Sphagnurus paluster]
MSQNPQQLVGSVFERTKKNHSVPKIFTATKTGFPVVQHRSKSAFARSREESRKTSASSTRDVPKLVPSQTFRVPSPVDPDEWRNQMSRENEERVATMTEEQRAEERQEIIQRFGAGVGDLLKRVKLARERQAKITHNVQDDTSQADQDNQTLEEVPITAWERLDTAKRPVSPPPPALSTSSTRPSSRADRRLRFAQLSPEDVHVYESAPPSPRRKVLALPPSLNDGTATYLGQFHGNLAKPDSSPPSPEIPREPEEGSAEYIRRRYFPDAPANDPNLAWMQQSQHTDPEPSSLLRFDLTGKPIPASMSSTLPTHLGLHHHAEGAHAGYTLDDVFLLSRSTVPAQRATMLGVLVGIARRISRIPHGELDGMEELAGKEEDLRKRIMAAGIEAMSERGSVGARAIEVVWQCIVGWDEDITGFSGVELESPTDLALKSLRLDFFLPQITTLFAQGEMRPEARLQILAVLHRLAQQSNEIASSIVTTPKLIANVVQSFLLTPIPPTETSPSPDSFALELLIVLAKASRENANALKEPADALLRFVTFLPSSSIYPSQLATSLLISTLRFYTTLAMYGLYSHIATTAMEHFTKLGQYVLSSACTSYKLMVAWTDLLAVWMVCAVDPHQTTPGHDILWSQIIGWGWNTEVDDLGDRLGADEKDWPVWAGVWKVRAAWLEGAKRNGIRGGSSERMESLEVFRYGFEEGTEKEVVLGCLDAIQRELGHLGSSAISPVRLPNLRALEKNATILVAALRLFLACLPPLSDGPLDSPPFPLPFPRISELCARIVVHPVWLLLSPSYPGVRHGYVHLRSLSELLSVYIRLSRRLPGISDELWAAQSLSVLSKLLPGEEEFASHVIDDLFSLMTPGWVNAKGIRAPSVIWDRGGMLILKPFVAYMIRPHRDAWIGPACATPLSISKATTQLLPSITALRNYGLPLTRDWTLIGLDHLLRSGSSEVFKALPSEWDSSEIDVVRTSFLLTRVCRELLHHFALTDFVLTREEAVFGCMKVFMLEHGQTHSDLSEEVFRDRLVGQLMDDLLRPYTVSSTRTATNLTAVIPAPTNGDLEQVAAKFLGTTPFYQYYTDFVALYDAISFSQPLFARLLLPPTSMRYALDYRKHLWNDFGYILKTIRTPIDLVISGDLNEYLWPIETDPQMLGSYLRALFKQNLQGVLELVAIHHIASNIWPDLQDGGRGADDRASKLLHTVVEQGGIDLVRQVVQYCQTTSGAVLVPPQCFEALDDKFKVLRLDAVTRWGLGDRLQGLFSLQ